VSETTVRTPAAGMDPAARLQEIRQLAGQLQHDMNNPLAALLAELQLLGMEEDLPAQHRTSVERSIELLRRVIGLTRRLDEFRT
jgi:signal transduction histidine kinase